MVKEHHYAAKLTWAGAAKGSVRGYAAYSREYSVAFAGKPDLTPTEKPQIFCELPTILAGDCPPG